jgi:hypothetical protein
MNKENIKKLLFKTSHKLSNIEQIKADYQEGFHMKEVGNNYD